MPWDLHALLTEAIRQGASDLHLSNGVPPTLRIDGLLQPLELPRLTREDLVQMIYSILNAEQKVKFETDWELDFSIEVRNVGRFRVNVHKQRGAVEAAFRVVHEKIRTIRQLGLPPVVEDIAQCSSGLVLITGPTGSGKTSTMAAMVDQINSERASVIITIEDPIEYIHQHRRSIVKQREVRTDTMGFAPALRHVLRQDPDIIGIGEMRDLETISTALTAAETGHLVLATIHTPDTIQTVDRIIDVFPPGQQQQVRMQFAATLQAIIAQQLLPVPGQRGRVVAVEVLIGTIAAKKVIRAAKTEQLITVIQTGHEHGMISMDKSLKNLYQQGLVSYEDAMAKVKYPEAWDHL
jgi:twitching motility protein PilT